MTHIEKAKHFFSLHQAGDPLVLYNVWDAGTAAAAARAGAKAIATGSHSVAEAHGYADGQHIPLSLLLMIAERIVCSTMLPVSIDFEGGFAKDDETLASNIERLLATGAIGVNFEDQVIGSTDLYAPETQASRIATLRGVADQQSGSLFINARTDVFLKTPVDRHHEVFEDAILRATHYTAAGASGFFAPGLIDISLIERLCSAVELPVNIMMKAGVPTIARLAAAGVSRVSYGPGPYIEAISTFEQRAKKAMYS
ncbi:MAG: isocitrate lyase/phosphoenolpyruvate mutase family protein [Woeseiaceae bacterium]